MTEFNGVSPSLRVTDLDASLAFYTDVLGFVVDTLWPADAPTLAILDHGPVHLMLRTEGCHEDPSPAFTGDLRFDVAGVEELASALRGRVEIEWGPEVYHYGRREFGVRDPDGYLLIFSEPASRPAG
ncbi:MAG: hypothetical protein GWO00_07100, partial [Gemmatimonadetes bacterium]|nr:hypothetical protein [Gemmatimonadota bacterium]NIR78144.1 hypothetical protein [Gemmatimonadota bacterium]NIT86711.1 hypothetical protein [Gemmatimonadota bacterium]NIU30568.1 hypothetical protein [Gemmatimonadota bacterium]NIV60934.1 hypothetical protein [Gemmatimonadota bacterium]